MNSNLNFYFDIIYYLTLIDTSFSSLTFVIIKFLISLKL